MDEKEKISKKIHDAEGRQKIERLQKKIDTTKYNIETSKEIIAETPSAAQRDKLIEKNTQREHAIGSMKKEIHDIERIMEDGL